MFSKLTKRTLVVLIAVIALVATTAGPASAAGPDTDTGPAGIRDIYGPYDLDYSPLFPWEHTVVVVHVTAGSEPNPGAKNPGIVDVYGDIPTLSEYASGSRTYLVDVVISVHPDGVSVGWTNDGEGAGGSRDSRQDEYGDIALGLYKARDFCWNEAVPCDVILVTYESPESETHRRHAMAEAMRLAVVGAQLHTIVIDLGSECVGEPTPGGGCSASDLVSKVDPAHVEFSQLLGAVGHNAVVDALSFPDTLDWIVERRFIDRIPIPWTSDEEIIETYPEGFGPPE